MRLAVQNDAAVIIRDLDHQSVCCCGLPCVEWSRYAGRFNESIYGNSPPPSFPCCGMLQSYSVGGGTWEWSRQDFAYMLAGSITVSAQTTDGPTGRWSTFSGVYDGLGGFLYVRDTLHGGDFSPYRPDLQATAYARLYVGRAPFFSTINHPGRCYSELWIGIGDSNGIVRTTLVSNMVKLGDRGQLTPTGFYNVLGDSDSVFGVGGLTIS